MSDNDQYGVQLTTAQMAMMAGTGLEASMLSNKLGKFSSGLYMHNGKVQREVITSILGVMADHFEAFGSQIRGVLNLLEEAPPVGDGTPLVTEDILSDIDDLFKGGAA